MLPNQKRTNVRDSITIKKNDKNSVGDDSPYLLMAEAAKYVHISISTLRKHTAKNRIPHFKPSGKIIIFKKSDLDKWINRGRIPTNDELLE